MKRRLTIIDECVSPKVTSYLQRRGIATYKMKRGTRDYDIMKKADEMGAYILTRDHDFRYNKNAIYIGNWKPGTVYKNLRKLMESEF